METKLMVPCCRIFALVGDEFLLFRVISVFYLIYLASILIFWFPVCLTVHIGAFFRSYLPKFCIHLLRCMLCVISISS